MLRVAYELLNVCKDENGQSVKRYARDELRHLEDAWRRPSKDRVGRREPRKTDVGASSPTEFISVR